MKTTTPTQLKGNDRKWYIIDAKDIVLGKIATTIASILRGKNKVSYTQHLDNGDFVVVINCDKFRVSGTKMDNKMYYNHTGYIGHLRKMNLRDMLEKHPEAVITNAVAGMISNNKIKKDMLSRLKVFVGDKHDHTAQKPEPLKI